MSRDGLTCFRRHHAGGVGRTHCQMYGKENCQQAAEAICHRLEIKDVSKEKKSAAINDSRTAQAECQGAPYNLSGNSGGHAIVAQVESHDFFREHIVPLHESGVSPYRRAAPAGAISE